MLVDKMVVTFIIGTFSAFYENFKVRRSPILCVTFRNPLVTNVTLCLPALRLRCKTTPFLLSATVYSLYSQLP